ncbi:unnamed protein product [Symbiodinium natans]|uniref:Uncharacterized protein n=1 Tax=Symbiodinium natans TaxID=878477 RepID=A0A812ULY2_9DINO|nr:unnamed protein product [Symbiodinium natans]
MGYDAKKMADRVFERDNLRTCTYQLCVCLAYSLSWCAASDQARLCDRNGLLVSPSKSLLMANAAELWPEIRWGAAPEKDTANSQTSTEASESQAGRSPEDSTRSDYELCKEVKEVQRLHGCSVELQRIIADKLDTILATLAQRKVNRPDASTE